ncbi:MAG: translocation/assembly module TamB domain-containing protein [Minwuia sp.]|nr:translocation/assembly module TamB domain-containing protein [Minwuia sp.]
MRRRMRRILLWSLAILLTPVLLVLAAAFWFLELAGEDTWTAALDLGLAQANSPGELEISASGFLRDEEGVIHLGRLELADGQGVWLTLDQLVLDWRLRDLFGRAVTIDALTVGAIDVRRPPISAADTEPEPETGESILQSFDWPRAPVAVRLDLLRVDRLTLGDGIVPGGANFRIEGSALDAGSTQALKLDVQPLDLQESFARADIALDLASRVSRMGIAVDLPAIAPVSDVLGITPDERLLLNVSGGGPFGSATLEASATVQRVVDLLLGLELKADPETGWSLTADGVVNLLDAAPVPTELTGEVIPFRFAAAGPDETRARLQVLEVSTRSATLAASGSVDLGSGTVDLSATVDAHRHPALDALMTGATFDTAQVRAHVTGTFDSPALDVAADLAAPAFGDMGAEAITLAIKGGLAGSDFAGDVALTVTNPAMGDPELDGLLGATPRLTASIDAGAEQVRVTALDLTASAFGLTGNVVTPLPDPVLNGELVLLLPDLSRLPGANAALRNGGAHLVVTLDNLQPAGGGEVRLAGDVRQLSFIDPVLGRLIGPAVRLSATARPGAEANAVDVSVDTAAGPSLKADARLSGAGALDGRYSVSVPALPDGLLPETTTLDGPVRLQGTLAGTADAPWTRGQLSLDAVVSGDIRIDRPVLAYDVRNLATNPAGTVALDGTWGGEALDLDLSFAMADAFQRLDLSALSLSLAGLKVDGNGQFALATPAYRADLAVTSDALAPLGALFGVPLAGSLDAKVALAPEGGDHAADVVVRLQDLQAPDAGVRVRAVALSLELKQLLSALPRLGGTLAVENVEADGARIELLDARLGGTFERPAVEVRATATDPEPANLRTLIVANLAGTSGPEIEVQALRLEGGDAAIEAVQPFRVVVGDIITLSGLRLGTSFGGEVLADVRYAADLLDATVRISALPLGPLAAIAGIAGVAGQLAADVRFDSTAPDDKARLVLQVDGLHPPGDDLGASFDIVVNGAWNGKVATARTEVSGPFDTPLTAEVRAAVGQDVGSFLPVPDPEGALQGRIDWQGDLAQMMQLLPEGDNLLSGRAVVSVNLSGTVGAPVLQGQIGISEGRYENLMTGTVLEALTLDTTFADSGEGQLTLSAVDRVGGTIDGAGTARLLGADRNAAVQINLNRLRAVNREEATALLSGRTDVNWDGKLLKVTNRTIIDEAEIRLIADNLPPSVVDIDLANDIGTPAPEPQQEEPAEDLPILLDVEVDAPSKLFVRGRGLDTEWAGTVTVKGQLPDPVLDVSIGVVRGQLSLLGKDFQVSTGEIGLTGNLQPRFNIELTRQTGDLEGTISISGSPAKPTIAFSSTPELPEDEVLPRLLFDKPAQSMSPLEAIQLAQSINTLTNGGGGTTDKLRKAVGLDVLRVEEGNDPDSAGSVAVGRYVREGVYVGAKQSLDSEAGSVVVEIDVLPNLKVDAEVGRGGGGSTGLTWERRY